MPFDSLSFDSSGDLPCLLTDAEGGEFLWLAKVSRDALETVLETGLLTTSADRSRIEPGDAAVPGVMDLVELQAAPGGALLHARVLPRGANPVEDGIAFPTLFKNKDLQEFVESRRTRKQTGKAERLGKLLERLHTLLVSRRSEMPDGSYSTYLFSGGTPRISAKLGEQAVELALAAQAGGEALLGELADVVFHLLALMVERSVSLDDLRRILDERHSKKGAAGVTRVLRAGQTKGYVGGEIELSRPSECASIEERLLKYADSSWLEDARRALEVMYRAHAGQMRDGGGAYAAHPLHVGLIVVEECKLRTRESMLAAVLHDVLEDDLDTTPGELAQLFGNDVAEGVVLLTKMYKRDGTPAELGLRRYYEGLRGAPEWVKTVKLCDRIHNLRTLPGSGRSSEAIASYQQETRESLLPLCATGTDPFLLKAGELLIAEMHR